MKNKKTPKILNSTSPFGDFPSSFTWNKKTTKENQKCKKKAKNLFGTKMSKFTSDFWIYYDRGDIPIRVYHSGSLNKIKWNIDPSKIDLK